MKWKAIAAAAWALSLGMPQAAWAQNEAPEVDIPSPVEEIEAELDTPAVRPAPREDNVTAVQPAPAPAPAVTQPVETIEAPEIINPYANSYNELLPVEAAEEQGFDDWGLLGLLGIFGLFGLKRRHTIVYAERMDRSERRD